jgi:hypothetical protein
MGKGRRASVEFAAKKSGFICGNAFEEEVKDLTP